MKSTLFLLILVCSASLTLFADMLPFTSNGEIFVGAGISYQYTINDSIGSSNQNFAGVTGGTTYAQVPFAFTMSLPSIADYALNSALLSFSGTTTYGVDSGYNSYGSQGYYLSGTHPIYCHGYFGSTYYCGTGNDYSNGYVPAQASFNGGSYAELTGITDGIQSASVGIGGGTLDLLALGFGDDLLSGGTLTLTGYRQIYSGLSSISYNGSNAYTNFYVSVNGSGGQSASLSLGGNQVVSSLDGVPEPSSGVLFFGGISMIILYWFGAKRIKA